MSRENVGKRKFNVSWLISLLHLHAQSKSMLWGREVYRGNCGST